MKFVFLSALIAGSSAFSPAPRPRSLTALRSVEGSVARVRAKISDSLSPSSLEARCCCRCWCL